MTKAEVVEKLKKALEKAKKERENYAHAPEFYEEWMFEDGRCRALTKALNLVKKITN